MRYRIMFHTGPELNLRTPVRSGKLALTAEELRIDSPRGAITIPVVSLRRVEMSRLPGLGRVLKVTCADRTLWLAVIRFSLGSYFVLGNYLKTGELCERLQAVVASA
ncbi:MAG: hypothetical protein ACK47B_22700 [Armatimonadota bacterium]